MMLYIASTQITLQETHSMLINKTFNKLQKLAITGRIDAIAGVDRLEQVITGEDPDAGLGLDLEVFSRNNN